MLALRPTNPNDWNLIADNLQTAWAKDEITVKGRSCKEHFDVLLRHHKDENSAALKKYLHKFIFSFYQTLQPLNNEQIAEGLIVKFSGQALRSSIMKFINF